jgi:hypothetical protein
MKLKNSNDCIVLQFISRDLKDMDEEIIKPHCKVAIKFKSTEPKLDIPDKV